MPLEREITLREIHPREEVAARIRELASAVHRDYAGRELLLVAIAEGGRRFALALCAALDALSLRPDLTFVGAARTRGMRLGRVRVDPVDASCFAGREVLLVDDIADEGRTLHAVASVVLRGKPRSLRTAVLVSKQARRRMHIPLDYVGFDVESGWVVGFGMDLDGAGRDLDYLAVVER